VNQPGVSGKDVLRQIEQRHGAEAARIVDACSDTLPEAGGGKKPPWRQRKESYLKHLRSCDASTLLVSAADKLHNLRATLAEWRSVGDVVFDRFNTGDGHTRQQRREQTLWYFRSLNDIYVDPSTIVDNRRARICAELAAVLGELQPSDPK
jgi:hypothetical protein